MYRLRDVVAAMARALVVPQATIETYSRRLQERHVLPKGAPRHSPELDAQQVMALLLAVLTDQPAVHAADIVEKYAALRGPGIYFGNEILRLFRLAGRYPPGSLDVTVEICTSWPGGSVTVDGTMSHFVDIAPDAPRPAFERSVRITGRTLQRLAHHLREQQND